MKIVGLIYGLIIAALVEGIAMIKIRKIFFVPLVLALFLFPGHELLFYVMSGAAAQSGGFGAQKTSPVVVGTNGFIPFNAGPQSTVIATNGGTFTANSTSAVTITNTNITANSVVIFGLKTANSPNGMPYMATVTPGTSFTVKAGSGDTSVYNYWILG